MDNEEIKQVFYDKLMSAEDQAKKYPYSFFKPSEEFLLHLEIGDIVKLCNGEERFWVVLTSVNHDLDYYEGEINNPLVSKHGYDYGDLIAFKRENIYQAKTKEERKAFLSIFMDLFVKVNGRLPSNQSEYMSKIIAFQKYVDHSGELLNLNELIPIFKA